eukprot:GHVU01074793.1.p1 GENE.GHVU01074793.1~~GHVU01074793.1.p1  ORF type:complete len:178 (+),score=37.56 GHVU01074793.1:91-624(+)
MAKDGSVFSTLEDTCMAPGGSDKAFVNGLKNHPKLKTNPAFKEMKGGGDVAFTIQHTIADIVYNATNFLLKNKDMLKAELTETVQASTNPCIAALFEGVVVVKGKLAKGQLIASQFSIQLQQMMGIILETEPHFIRCIKPNESKKPLEWNAAKVLNQLFSLSIMEALQLKQLGCSYR